MESENWQIMRGALTVPLLTVILYYSEKMRQNFIYASWPSQLGKLKTINIFCIAYLICTLFFVKCQKTDLANSMIIGSFVYCIVYIPLRYWKITRVNKAAVKAYTSYAEYVAFGKNNYVLGMGKGKKIALLFSVKLRQMRKKVFSNFRKLERLEGKLSIRLQRNLTQTSGVIYE